MKALEAAAWLILLVIIGAVLAGGYAVYRIISAAVTAVPSVAWLAVGGVALFAFTLVIVGGAIYIVKSLAARIKRIYAKDGLFPLVNLGNGLFYNGNELGAQSLKALASGRRPTAALAGRVIDAHYRAAVRAAVDALPEQVAALAAPPLTVEDVTAVDPRTDPHWLLVGGTGSGKTSASYAICSARWSAAWPSCAATTPTMPATWICPT